MRVIHPPTHTFSLPFQKCLVLLRAFPPSFSVTFIDCQVFFPSLHQPASLAPCGFAERREVLSPQCWSPTQGWAEPFFCSAPHHARADGRPPPSLCHFLAGSLPFPRQITLPSSGAEFVKSHQPAVTMTGEIKKEKKKRNPNPAEQLPTKLLTRGRSSSVKTTRSNRQQPQRTQR